MSSTSVAGKTPIRCRHKRRDRDEVCDKFLATESNLFCFPCGKEVLVTQANLDEKKPKCPYCGKVLMVEGKIKCPRCKKDTDYHSRVKEIKMEEKTRWRAIRVAKFQKRYSLKGSRIIKTALKLLTLRVPSPEPDEIRTYLRWIKKVMEVFDLGSKNRILGNQLYIIPGPQDLRFTITGWKKGYFCEEKMAAPFYIDELIQHLEAFDRIKDVFFYYLGGRVGDDEILSQLFSAGVIIYSLGSRGLCSGEIVLGHREENKKEVEEIEKRLEEAERTRVIDNYCIRWHIEKRDKYAEKIYKGVLG